MTGGAPRYRWVIDDELTDANRASAFGAGFVTMLVVGVAAYLVGFLESGLPVYAAPATLSCGVATASPRFSLLEWVGDELTPRHG